MGHGGKEYYITIGFFGVGVGREVYSRYVWYERLSYLSQRRLDIDIGHDDWRNKMTMLNCIFFSDHYN